MKQRLWIVLFFPILCITFLSTCSYKKISELSFYDANETMLPVYALSHGANKAAFKLSNQKQYFYEIENKTVIPKNHCLEIDYVIEYAKATNESMQSVVTVKIENGKSWILPLDMNVLGFEPDKNLRYAIPLTISEIQNISFDVESTQKENTGIFRINSLRIRDGFYGAKQEDKIVVSPFFSKAALSNNSTVFTIEPLQEYVLNSPVTLSLRGLSDVCRIHTNGRIFDYSYFVTDKSKQNINIPYGALPDIPYPVTLLGNADSMYLASASILDSNMAISADPGIILSYPPGKWRSPQYEFFSWDIFPQIIIFDTKNYEQQDKLFKRLAFFAEKKGFRGRLASDKEIEGLHGWNAHDYNAQTLVNFFNMAAKQNFNLLEEEKQLCGILIAAGIMLVNDAGYDEKYREGTGAVISISRESPEYLRGLFMVHEGFHGIFFIDEDFRKFTNERWTKLNPAAKRFLLSFFDYQQYDIKDNYLVLNEFMAHCLQQNVSAAGEYFGKTIAQRIEAIEWRASSLPKKNEESGTWPLLADSFYAEADAFSKYASVRWGLRAGKVWRVQ
ncbi:MAG: hypothetical protein Ta2F_03440 [Termitinemataceae bacterium]|nr:MAG: hypothetical protein Ta2F_03440 [Termitinemataceae bacterium]